jgi:hypothetical protein
METEICAALLQQTTEIAKMLHGLHGLIRSPKNRQAQPKP